VTKQEFAEYLSAQVEGAEADLSNPHPDAKPSGYLQKELLLAQTALNNLQSPLEDFQTLLSKYFEDSYYLEQEFMDPLQRAATDENYRAICALAIANNQTLVNIANPSSNFLDDGQGLRLDLQRIASQCSLHAFNVSRQNWIYIILSPAETLSDAAITSAISAYPLRQ